MNSSNETYEKVITIVSGMIDIDADELSEETLLEDLDIDLFNMPEMISALEDAFGVTIPEDAFDEAKTIEDIIEVIDES